MIASSIINTSDRQKTADMSCNRPLGSLLAFQQIAPELCLTISTFDNRLAFVKRAITQPEPLVK